MVVWNVEKLLKLSDLPHSVDEKERRNHKQEERKCMTRGDRWKKEVGEEEEKETEVGAYVSQTWDFNIWFVNLHDRWRKRQKPQNGSRASVRHSDGVNTGKCVYTNIPGAAEKRQQWSLGDLQSHWTNTMEFFFRFLLCIYLVPENIMAESISSLQSSRVFFCIYYKHCSIATILLFLLSCKIKL